MLIVGCLEEILGGDGEEILGGDVGELTVFPLGPGNGEEPKWVAPAGPSWQGEQLAQLVLGEETGELQVQIYAEL